MFTGVVIGMTLRIAISFAYFSDLFVGLFSMICASVGTHQEIRHEWREHSLEPFAMNSDSLYMRVIAFTREFSEQ